MPRYFPLIILLLSPRFCWCQSTADQRTALADHIQKAHAYLGEKRPDLAIPELQAAVAIDPANAETQGNLGVLLYFQGKVREALPHLRAALESQPGLGKIQGLLGLGEIQTLDAAAGQKDLEAAFPLIDELKFKIQVGLELVTLYSQSGDLEEANRVLTQLRKEGSAAHREVEEVIGLVNNAIDSTRVLARGLSPVGSGRGDLGAAIQTLAARVSECSGVRVVCHLDCVEPLPLSETAAAHVYRIVQEALTNAMRHSGAREVSIRLKTTDDELHLRVSDDGRGFEHPPADGPGGMGLKIMRYRAQMLGGDLVIETTGCGGTSVSCSCPLDLSVEPQVNCE